MIERQKRIKEILRHWESVTLKTGALPVLYVTMRTSSEVTIWRGGEFRNYHIKVILQAIVDAIPDDNNFFDGAKMDVDEKNN